MSRHRESEWAVPTEAAFNLVDEPWIPVVDRDGQRLMVGIRNALARSHELERLDCPSALEDVAVLRLLLAILHRALDGPRSAEEWHALWSRKGLDDPRIDAYLAAQRDRFWLLHPDRPFMQSTQLLLDGSRLPLSVMRHDAASGNNQRLFDKSRDAEVMPVSAATAARALVTILTWTRTGQGYGSSRVEGRAMVVLGMRETLQEHLILNLVRYDPTSSEPFASNGDLPAWERETPGKVLRAERAVCGYLDLLTRRPAAFRLLTTSQGDCGAVQRAPGERIPATAKYVREPSVMYETKSQQLIARAVPSGAPLWRELPALLAARSREKAGGFHCGVLAWHDAVGIADPQVRYRIVSLDHTQARYRLVTDSELRMPVHLLDEPSLRAVYRALSASLGEVAEHLEWYVKQATNVHKQRRKKGAPPPGETFIRTAMRAYWTSARAATNDALARLGDERLGGAAAGALEQAWRRNVWRSVDSAVETVERTLAGEAQAVRRAAHAHVILRSAVRSSLEGIVDQSSFVSTASAT